MQFWLYEYNVPLAPEGPHFSLHSTNYLPLPSHAITVSWASWSRRPPRVSNHIPSDSFPFNNIMTLRGHRLEYRIIPSSSFPFNNIMTLRGHPLVGLVAKASTSRVSDPGFDSRLATGFLPVELYQWLKNWHSSASLPGVWQRWGWPALCQYTVTG